MISRYLKVIPVSLHQITNSNWKLTDFVCPILCKKATSGLSFLSIANPLLCAFSQVIRYMILAFPPNLITLLLVICFELLIIWKPLIAWTVFDFPWSFKLLAVDCMNWWVLIIIYFLFNTTCLLPVYAQLQFLNLYRPKKPNVASTLAYWGTFSLYNLLCSNHVLFS